MQWYWWVLIAVAVVAISILKMRVWKIILEKRKNRVIDDEGMDE